MMVEVMMVEVLRSLGLFVMGYSLANTVRLYKVKKILIELETSQIILPDPGKATKEEIIKTQNKLLFLIVRLQEVCKFNYWFW